MQAIFLNLFYFIIPKAVFTLGNKANIAGLCQQTFCFQKFVDSTQQYFAFTPQANLKVPIYSFS